MNKLSKLLKQQQVVILDSAMGTELAERGMNTTLPLWSARAIIDDPDSIRQIHIDNIEAGADIITTNTFRTQKRTLEKVNYSKAGLDFAETAEEFTRIAVDIARDAVMETKSDVLIAGCIAPLEDCYKPELVPDTDTLSTEHNEHINNLAEAGVDILWAETMGSVREISAVINQLHQTGMEYCISMLCRNEKELYSGEKLKDAVSIIGKFSPIAVLINCIHPSSAESILLELKKMTDKPLGVYANIGELSRGSEGKFERTVTPQEYLDFALRWKSLGAKIIGGCCGTTPEYIEEISILKHKK
jgi:S-methylmethionine-dependent homocysteine/selenocysteine methylase